MSSIDKGIPNEFMDKGIYIRTREKCVSDGKIFVEGEWVNRWDERLELYRCVDGVHEYRMKRGGNFE